MAKKWSRKFLSDWTREPLTPITQTWEMPAVVHETAVVIKRKFGLSFDEENSTKIINGYFYITGNYARFLLNPKIFVVLIKILFQTKTAKKIWHEKVTLLSDNIDELQKKNLSRLDTKELSDFCDKVITINAQAKAWGLYVGIYSFGFEYLLSKLFPLFVKNSKSFDYRELLLGFDSQSLKADRGIWELAKYAKENPRIEALFIEQNNKKIWEDLQNNQYEDFRMITEQWLRNYSHQINDIDLIYPTIQESPHILIALIKQFRSQTDIDPKKSLNLRIKEREKVERDILSRVRWWIPFGSILFINLIKTTQSYVALRDDRAFYYKGSPLVRKILFELGARFKQGGVVDNKEDIFFLTKEEIFKLSQNNLSVEKEKIAERKKLREKQKNILAPIEVAEPITKGFPEREIIEKTSAKKFFGAAASKGQTVGRARVIFSQDDFDKFNEGEILVTKATTPAWTPLITIAKGVVTDVGGVLCHAAIVSRELEIPAVTGTKTATASIRTSDFIFVDGDEGFVEIVDENLVLIDKNNGAAKIKNITHNTAVPPKAKRNELIVPITSVANNDTYLVGGKGASLGELVLAGLNVPQGFIVTTEMYKKNIANHEKELLREFDKLNTTFVAVRSSATAEDSPQDSFAGQFETYLNVRRNDLLRTIQSGWDSINNKRIIEYAKAKGIELDKIKVAVVVQKMLKSEAAGICFTANPVTREGNHVMIEAIYGLGELIVSGQTTPDTYIVEKRSWKILEKKVEKQIFQLGRKNDETVRLEVSSEKQSLQKISDDKIAELAKLAVKAEAHYNQPLDLEWAYENEVLYFLQARPITTP